MAEPAKKFALAPVNLRVDDASLDLARPLPVTLDALINGHARFEAAGTLTPEPLAADLDVKLAKARMQILQPYVLPVADLTINGGELGVAGKVRLDPPGGERPELAFDGDVTIDGFRSVDNSLNEDLVNFERLHLQKLSYTMAPDALSIDRVLVRQPYARVIISQEQILNIAAVLDPQGTAAALAERRAAAAAEAARTPAERRSARARAEGGRQGCGQGTQVGHGARRAAAVGAGCRDAAHPHPRGAHRARPDELLGLLRRAGLRGRRAGPRRARSPGCRRRRTRRPRSRSRASSRSSHRSRSKATCSHSTSVATPTSACASRTSRCRSSIRTRDRWPATTSPRAS